jgi:hypothetical protein
MCVGVCLLALCMVRGASAVELAVFFLGGWCALARVCSPAAASGIISMAVFTVIQDNFASEDLVTVTNAEYGSGFGLMITAWIFALFAFVASPFA